MSSFSERMRIYPPTLSKEAAVSSETLTVTYKTKRYQTIADRKMEQVIFLNLLNLTITPDVICSYYTFRFHL